MPFIADEIEDSILWSYILGDSYKKSDSYTGLYKEGLHGMSIASSRYYYLQELKEIDSSLKISCRNVSNDYWTRWVPFPGLLAEGRYSKYQLKSSGVTAAIDVHRSVLSNEIVIESDYPNYEENCEASRIIGSILEHKGFYPHYYYSGNKSVHIHVFLDWSVLDGMHWDEFDSEAKEMSSLIDTDIQKFKFSFMEWLRKKMISCWDMKAREFDTDLIRASHLIRAELSKNKRGFKTFLGYSYKDVSAIPYICNEENKIYPRLGSVRLSQPTCIKELILEFQKSMKDDIRVNKIHNKNKTLWNWDGAFKKKKLRNCVKAILSDDFKDVGDGLQRAMFILVNELRAVLGDDQARIIVDDWNKRMGSPIKQGEIDYRFGTKNYTLTCKRIHKLLNELGVDADEKCKRKL